jgi:hypothetical protein
MVWYCFVHKDLPEEARPAKMLSDNAMSYTVKNVTKTAVIEVLLKGQAFNLKVVKGTKDSTNNI